MSTTTNPLLTERTTPDLTQITTDVDLIRLMVESLDYQIPGWHLDVPIDSDGDWLAFTMLLRAFLSRRRQRDEWADA